MLLFFLTLLELRFFFFFWQTTPVEYLKQNKTKNDHLKHKCNIIKYYARYRKL